MLFRSSSLFVTWLRKARRLIDSKLEIRTGEGVTISRYGFQLDEWDAKLLGGVRVVTLPLKNVSLAEWFNSDKENGNDQDNKGALHAGVQARGG